MMSRFTEATLPQKNQQKKMRFTERLQNDGTVWAWGYNQYGQIGNGTFENPILSPAQVANLNNIVSLSVGETHVLALKADGTIWGWGQNDYGQVGNNSKSNVATPVHITW